MLQRWLSTTHCSHRGLPTPPPSVGEWVLPQAQIFDGTQLFAIFPNLFFSSCPSHKLLGFLWPLLDTVTLNIGFAQFLGSTVKGGREQLEPPGTHQHPKSTLSLQNSREFQGGGNPKVGQKSFWEKGQDERRGQGGGEKSRCERKPAQDGVYLMQKYFGTQRGSSTQILLPTALLCRAPNTARPTPG